MTKFDIDKPLFVGEKPAREGTVFDAIRKAVDTLDSGSGVAYSDLEADLLANFTPRSAASFDGAYIKAYARDAVNKFGHLSHDASSDYSAIEPVAKSGSGKSRASKDSTLLFIADKGEVGAVDEINESRITVDTIVQETKKKTKTVEALVEELTAEELVRTEQREESTYVFLTEAGWNSVCELRDKAEEEAEAPAEVTQVGDGQEVEEVEEAEEAEEVEEVEEAEEVEEVEEAEEVEEVEEVAEEFSTEEV